MRKRGVWYDPDKLNGWQLGKRPHAGEHWVLTNDGVRCIVHRRLLVKWSVSGEWAVMWHPQPVTEADYHAYNPPAAPEDIEIQEAEKTPEDDQ